MDGLAGGEGDPLPYQVHCLRREAYEVHLHAALDGVPAGAVGEGVEIEAGVELAIEVGEDVLVEGRGDSGGVVVSREQRLDGLGFAGGEIGAEQQRVTGGEMGAERAQDGCGLGGREVADAGADVEREDAVVRGAGDGVALGYVVGDVRLDAQAGDACERGVGGFERGGADVDGLLEDLRLEARGGAEKDAGLGGGAGAQLRDGDRRLERAEDLIGAGGEDGALGAGEVVLGESGYLFEELRAEVVVKEPRWEGLLRRGGEAGEGGLEDCVVEGGESGGGHRVLG